MLIQKWFHPIAAIHMRYFTPELIFDKFFSTKWDNKNSRKLNTKITIMFMILSTHMTHHIFSKEAKATKSCLVMVYTLFTFSERSKIYFVDIKKPQTFSLNKAFIRPNSFIFWYAFYLNYEPFLKFCRDFSGFYFFCNRESFSLWAIIFMNQKLMSCISTEPFLKHFL